MRRKEKALIEKAVDLLHQDDGWDGAMEILTGLIGRKTLVGQLKDGGGMGIREICRKLGNKDQEFMYGVQDGFYNPPKSDNQKLMDKLNIKKRRKV